MIEKTITIPLIHDRPLKMRFVKINENQYQCVASDEYLVDIETFFNNNYYDFDSLRRIEVMNK